MDCDDQDLIEAGRTLAIDTAGSDDMDWWIWAVQRLERGLGRVVSSPDAIGARIRGKR